MLEQKKDFELQDSPEHGDRFDQSVKNSQNLKTIVRKAIMIQKNKMFYKQENFFRIDGPVYKIIGSKKYKHLNGLLLKVVIFPSAMVQSTWMAMNHFAELGISSSIGKAKKPGAAQANDEDIAITYPSQLIGLKFYVPPLSCTFTRPAQAWQTGDAALMSSLQK